MWNSRCFRTDSNDKINEKMNEQLNVAIFARFDVILNVAIKRCERFDDIDAKQNIDFDVAKKINETSETNEQINVDFFLILHVNSDAKIRKFKFLTDFRTWCSRICSWNLLLNLKFCLQNLHFRTFTISWIDDFFIDFDVFSCVSIVKCKFSDEINRENIFAKNIWFRDVAKEINETCETNEQIIANFFWFYM